MSLFQLYSRAFLSTSLILLTSLSHSQEYEILSVGGFADSVRPAKINEKGYSVAYGKLFGEEKNSTFLVDPSGANILRVAGPDSSLGTNFSKDIIKNITNENEYVGAHQGALSIFSSTFTPYPKTAPIYGIDGLDYPRISNLVKLSFPYFAFNENNAVGTCYPSNVLPSTQNILSSCGYVGGVFKFFNFSTYPGSSLSEKEYLDLTAADSSATQLTQTAFSMTTDGVVVGSAVNNYTFGSNGDNINQTRAFSWTESGGMVDLGTLGGKHSVAFDINATKTIVGSAASS